MFSAAYSIIAGPYSMLAGGWFIIDGSWFNRGERKGKCTENRWDIKVYGHKGIRVINGVWNVE